MQGLMKPSVCLINGKRSEMAAEFNTASVLNWKQNVFKEPLSLFIVQAE